ncbi:DUF5951 family protein [Escherichia sp. MOD1-EC6475]|uniref:DUF5951 family protein n=1 Tax=Escherichia sp. MOD1-EC6475 TaxID=2162662 RepID=UPI00336A80E9
MNYRGIAVEAHLNGEKYFVKPVFYIPQPFAVSINSLLHLQTICRRKSLQLF